MQGRRLRRQPGLDPGHIAQGRGGPQALARPVPDQQARDRRMGRILRIRNLPVVKEAAIEGWPPRGVGVVHIGAQFQQQAYHREIAIVDRVE